MDKQGIIDQIIAIEGGYVNDPSDSGGETNFGITAKVAREYGYTGDMKDLPRGTAFAIYEDWYWRSVKADDLMRIAPSVAEEVVDTGINMGTSQASKFLQRSLNLLNNKASLYNDIIVDGKIGQATIKALTAYVAQRDPLVLTKMLNCLQGAFYVELAERREKDEKFIYGWYRNRVTL